MSLISVHRKYSFVDYQHHLCSFATLITFLALLIAIALPIFGILRLNNSQPSFTVYEQPNVKFTYKYIISAENSMESDESREILCSSFDVLSQFNESVKCEKIRVSEKDLSYDGITDEITFTFEFPTFHNFGIKSLAVVLFLDARIYNQCKFRIPAAVIIDKKLLSNFNNRKITINGVLSPAQHQGLQCPFFMRNVKSHFFFDSLSENHTNLEEFQLPNIRKRLERNPMNFQFHETSLDIGELDDNKTSVQINLKIPELPVRYLKTFWQKVMDAWISFLALFAVTFTIINYILNYLFEKRVIKARCKNYVKDKEF